MPRYYFEDFKVGEVAACGVRHVTEEEIISFARQFDPQPFHIDPLAARGSIYGGIIASGWHTCAMAMRLMCDAYLLETASMGSPGMDEIRWLRPVRGGDTLRLERSTVGARASASKPDRGVVSSEWRLYNQHDELVMTMRGMGMFLRRPQDPPTRRSAPFEPST
jgi:acyl dehydratase